MEVDLGVNDADGQGHSHRPTQPRAGYRADQQPNSVTVSQPSARYLAKPGAARGGFLGGKVPSLTPRVHSMRLRGNEGYD